MWHRTHFTMALRQRHSGNISGEHRAVLELAAAMQNELDLLDTEPSLLDEKQLAERVAKELRGGAISYAYPKQELNSFRAMRALRGWFQREKWWFLAILLTSVLASTIWMVPYLFIIWVWFIGAWFGQVCAFCIGTTTGSRTLIVLFWSAISLVVAGTIFGMFFRP